MSKLSHQPPWRLTRVSRIEYNSEVTHWKAGPSIWKSVHRPQRETGGSSFFFSGKVAGGRAYLSWWVAAPKHRWGYRGLVEARPEKSITSVTGPGLPLRRLRLTTPAFCFGGHVAGRVVKAGWLGGGRRLRVVISKKGMGTLKKQKHHLRSKALRESQLLSDFSFEGHGKRDLASCRLLPREFCRALQSAGAPGRVLLEQERTSAVGHHACRGLKAIFRLLLTRGPKVDRKLHS